MDEKRVNGNKSEEELEAEEALDELGDLSFPPASLRPESEQRLENAQKEIQRIQMHLHKVKHILKCAKLIFLNMNRIIKIMKV